MAVSKIHKLWVLKWLLIAFNDWVITIKEYIFWQLEPHVHLNTDMRYFYVCSLVSGCIHLKELTYIASNSLKEVGEKYLYLRKGMSIHTWMTRESTFVFNPYLHLKILKLIPMKNLLFLAKAMSSFLASSNQIIMCLGSIRLRQKSMPTSHSFMIHDLTVSKLGFRSRTSGPPYESTCESALSQTLFSENRLHAFPL